MNSSVIISHLISNKKTSREAVEFVYNKDGDVSWRKIDLSFEDSEFVKGFDLQDSRKFKSFKKKFIVGQKLIKVKS